jgi:hypothetical protein
MSWFDTSAIFRIQKRLICVALNKERDFFYSFPYRLVHVEFLYDIVFHCCRSVAKPAPAAKGGSRRRLPPPALTMATGTYPMGSAHPYPYPLGLNFTRRVTRECTRVGK